MAVLGLGKAFAVAGKGTTGVFGKLKDVTENAIAANNAHRANEAMADARDAANGKTHGTLYNIGEAVGDTIADTFNVATFGLSRKVGNVFDDKDSKLGYKSLKRANLGKDATIQSRANIMVNDSVRAMAASDDMELE